MGKRAKNELTDERLAKVSALDAVARRQGHTA